jgi:hypothetical protein
MAPFLFFSESFFGAKKKIFSYFFIKFFELNFFHKKMESC